MSLRFASGWVQHFGANLVSAFPPELGARFRYYERLRPQASLSAIVDRVLASDPDFRAHELGEMVRVVTSEGEYGGWVAIAGTRDGGPARRYVGAVFMGEFATALDVIALIPEHFAAVEALALELLRGQRFEMTKRPRQFFYVPPPGWHALPSGLIANWYPLDFPANLTNIVVPPATVVEGETGAAREAMLGELDAGLAVEDHVRSELIAECGVTGTAARVRGKRGDRTLYRDLAVFVVENYAYRMRFETANADQLGELREVFRAVATSFRPLPTRDELQSGRAFSARLDLFDHWAS